MHPRTLTQLNEGVKIIRNPDIVIPQEDGDYILTVNGGMATIKPTRKPQRGWLFRR